MNLVELRDRVLALPTLENRMEQLKGEIQKAESEVYELLRRYELESRDVEQIHWNMAVLKKELKKLCKSKED